MSSALNVITASFGGLREVTTSPLWQWDYGQILEITGLDLPQAFEVHFSNSRKSGETITQIGSDGQVTIPDMYLTSGADIYAFVFLHDGTDDGETEYVIKIPVRERPEPSDIEPTPVQQDVITEAIAALNDAVEQTGEDKEATAALAEAAAASSLVATEAAQSAQGSATSATASASTASTAATTASTKASEAATSAADAANAKTAAETAETNAQAAQTASESAQASAASAAQAATSKASEASTSAANASGSATAASASASAASGSATSAAASATAASGSATSAATSASTASAKASEASASATAAQTAQTAAEAAQTAAETAQTEAEAARDETVTEAASVRVLMKDKADIIISNAEGAIATFEDGGNNMPMVSCVAEIEPVQDLHGYDSPWPAGGGVNKLDPSQATSSGNSVYGMSMSWDSATGAFNVSGTYTGANSSSVFRAVNVPSSVRSLSVKGFSTSSNFNKMRWQYGEDKIVVDLQNMVQGNSYNITCYPVVYDGTEPTAFSPYSNICPISGWTGCNVRRVGKNLLNPNFSSYLTNFNYAYMNNVLKAGQTARFTLVDRDTSVDVTGCYIGFQTGISATQVVPTIYNWVVNNGTQQSNMTNVAYNNEICTGVFVCPKTEQTFNKIFSRWYVMVEYGSTATDYEPYTGTTYPISWQSEAGTVYGGTLDVVSGELVVDMAEVDLGTLTWNYVASSAFNFRASELIGAKTPANAVDKPNAICSILPVLDYTAISAPVDGITIIFATSAQAGKVCVHSGIYTDATAFKAAMTGQTLVYELATPQTYQLTPTEVRTLLGINNIWADTGDVELKYRADTKLYIDGKGTDFSKLIAPTEAAYTATRAYTSGSLLIVGSQLYKATTSIANGATLTVGTNITATTLAEVIAAL